jgi:hypothetical protein
MKKFFKEFDFQVFLFASILLLIIMYGLITGDIVRCYKETLNGIL